MEDLPKDVLYLIAMELEGSDVLSFGLTNKRINEKVCNNIHFMRNKLKRDFGFFYYEKNISKAHTYYYFLCKNKNKALNYKLILTSKLGYIDLVKYLVGTGANIHALNDDSLIWASLNGRIYVVKYLIENGADIHAQKDLALRCASENGHIDVVK